MSGPGDSVDGLPTAYYVTAAADNSSKSQIPNGATFVICSGVTNDGDDWIRLPEGEPGYTIRGWSVAAHELRTPSGSNIKINNIDSDSSQEAAIPATTMWEVTYINDTYGWILRAWTELGAVITAIVPD